MRFSLSDPRPRFSLSWAPRRSVRRACLLTIGACLPANGQDLTGSLVLGAEPGYTTNSYLDPMIQEWAPGPGIAFLGLAAAGILEWTDPGRAFSVAGLGRASPLGGSRYDWRAYRLQADLEQAVAPSYRTGVHLSLAGIGGPADRRVLLVLPYLAWIASPRIRLGLHTGVGRWSRTTEVERAPAPGPPVPVPLPEPAGDAETDPAATSVLLLLEGEGWTGASWSWGGQTYFSRTLVDDDTRHRGSGVRIEGTRWWPGGASLRLSGGVEQLGYRAAHLGIGPEEDDPTSDSDDGLLWTAGAALGLALGGNAAVETRVAALRHESTAIGDSNDVYLSTAVRFALRATLASRRAHAWTMEGAGLRFQVPYDGDGRLYLIGDFNAWEHPGLPLAPLGNGWHGRTLELAPGTYAYKILVIEDGSERWLSLPEGTPAVDDGFDGVNGVLIYRPEAVP